MVRLILYFVICLAATTVGAISGVGGGVIIKPVFDAVSGLEVAQISFLSGCTVLAMTVVSLLSARGGGVRVEARRGTLLALGGAAGGVLGKQLFEIVKRAAGNGALVGVVQSVLMVLLTAGVLLYMRLRPRIRTKNVQNGAMCVLIGVALGVLSAFLGIGGGPINLAVLYYFFSMDTKTAALNSLYVIFFSQIASLAMTLAGATVPVFDPLVLTVMAVGGVLGGMSGRRIARRLTGKGADRVFEGLLVVITLISVYNLAHYAQLL